MSQKSGGRNLWRASRPNRGSTSSLGDVLQWHTTFLNPSISLNAPHLRLHLMTAVFWFTFWWCRGGLGLMVFATPSQQAAAVSSALSLLFSTVNKLLFSSLPCFLQATCPKPLADLTASCWTLSSFPKSGLPGLQVAKLSLCFPVVPCQCQEGQGRSIRQPVSLHITQLLFHLVCREPHAVGSCWTWHPPSLPGSFQQACSSASKFLVCTNVPGTEISTYSCWTLWGFCWNGLQVSQVLLHLSSAINCVSNASAPLQVQCCGHTCWEDVLCHGPGLWWRHWMILLCYWPASCSTFTISWSSHWLLPLELGCWGNFQPSQLSIHPTRVSSPTKQECWRTWCQRRL